MLITKRKPASVGEIIRKEFLLPLGLAEEALADAMGVPSSVAKDLCGDRQSVTAPVALVLARVFGNGADFWLNLQRRSDLWNAMHSQDDIDRVARARPLIDAA